MSVAIETTEDLRVLLRKLGVKVTSVDELRVLLTTINVHYNPQAARTRMAKLVAISVPCVLGSIAGLVSVVLAGRGSDVFTERSLVGPLAVVWGASALVSVASLIFALTLSVGRGSRVSADKPPLGTPLSVDERIRTAITSDLSL